MATKRRKTYWRPPTKHALLTCAQIDSYIQNFNRMQLVPLRRELFFWSIDLEKKFKNFAEKAEVASADMDANLATILFFSERFFIHFEFYQCEVFFSDHLLIMFWMRRRGKTIKNSIFPIASSVFHFHLSKIKRLH